MGQVCVDSSCVVTDPNHHTIQSPVMTSNTIQMALNKGLFTRNLKKLMPTGALARTAHQNTKIRYSKSFLAI